MHFDGTFGVIQVPLNVMESDNMDPHIDSTFKWKSKNNVLQNTVIYHFHIIPIPSRVWRFENLIYQKEIALTCRDGFHLHLTFQMLNCHLPTIQRENGVSNFSPQELYTNLRKIGTGKINKFYNYKVDF